MARHGVLEAFRSLGRRAADFSSNTNAQQQLVEPDSTFASLFPFSTGLAGVDQPANIKFVHILMASFVILAAVTLAVRWAKICTNRQRHISIIGNPAQQRFWEPNGNWWWPWLKEHVLLAPFLKVRHNREFQISSAISIGTLPSRCHTLLLVAFVLCNLAYCLVLPYGQPAQEVLAAFRGRTGVLAAFNLIPTVLFALRNNPLIWILQVPYDTFNLFHRWIARIVIIEAVLHTVAWFVNTMNAGGSAALHAGFNTLPHGPSFTWGAISTVAFVLISIQAWSPLRHAFYETFLNVHKIMVIVTILGIYMHLKIDNLPQVPWVQLCVALWLMEYVARCFWIIKHNISFSHGVSQVTVEALPAEACRVTYHLTRPWFPSAGAHAHIYLPTISWWSSHPFSVAWTEIVGPKGVKDLDDLEKSKPLNAIDAFELSRRQLHGTASFVVRARTGMTRKLYEKASKQPNGVLTTWGFAEGPYGGHDSLASYGTLLFFAGGVGITHQISYVRDLIQGYAGGLTGTRKIILVWCVPNTEALEWVRPWMDKILRMSGRKDILKIMLFVTRPRSNREIQSSSGSVQMYPGRCDPQSIVDRQINERVGAMAVTVCGPGAFADDVRAAVRKRVQVGVVDFVEEAFTY